MNLWICGEYKSGDCPEVIWHFIGIFSTKEKAIASCHNINCFIFPFELNKESPEKTVSSSDMEYPLRCGKK